MVCYFCILLYLYFDFGRYLFSAFGFRMCKGENFMQKDENIGTAYFP